MKISDVLVAGYDNLEEAQQAVEQGKMAATVDQQASLQGYTGVLYAIKMIKGEQVPLETFVDVILINADGLK
jgi:ribose transport system substrate-binding protein